MVSKNPLNSYFKEILDELNVECLTFDADNYENDKEHGLPKRSDTVRGGSNEDSDEYSE